MAPCSHRARPPETGGDRNSHFGELSASIMPPGSAAAAPGRRAARNARAAKKQSIGEISIATAAGRDFGNSRRAGADEGQPQEPQHSGPKGRRDRLPPIPRSELESPGAVARINLPSPTISAKGMEGWPLSPHYGTPDEIDRLSLAGRHSLSSANLLNIQRQRNSGSGKSERWLQHHGPTATKRRIGFNPMSVPTQWMSFTMSTAS